MQWSDHLHPGDFDDQKLAGLIIQLNLSYPQWTYDDLAFPGFHLNSVNTHEKGYIDIRIPALRSHLMSERSRVPCHGAFAKGDNSSITCGADDPCYGDYGFTEYSSTSEYFYAALQLPAFSLRPASERPSSCPTHTFLYGKWGDDIESTEYHWYNCNATMEEIDVDTRLQIPSFTIDSDVPPQVVLNSGRKSFKKDAWAFPGLDELDYFLYNGLQNALVNGSNGVSAEELLNPEAIIKRLGTVWGIIMAQLIESNGRETFQDPFNSSWFVHPATSQAPVFEGTFHDGRDYLVQNGISTRILDGLLGGIVICALIALFSMRTDKVLPKSPCSIASVASFVAGSTFLRTMRDADLREKDLSQLHFSMGWWKVDRGVSSTSSIQTPSRSSGVSENREVPCQEERPEPSSQSDEIVGDHSIQPDSGSSRALDLWYEERIGEVLQQEGESEPSLQSDHSQNDEMIDDHSIQPGSNSPNPSGLRDKEPEEMADGRESIHTNLGFRASSLSVSEDREAEVENGEVLSRFGIDIDGYRPLLDDID